MGKIFCVMGKSSSGKDTIYKKLIENEELALKRLVPYTTRPMREGEAEGVEYHFTDEAGLEKLQQENKVIELRAYQTVHGVWKYFTVYDEQIDLDRYSYLVIGTLESWHEMCRYFGMDIMVPVYIEVEDGLRLSRALARERQQETPKYAEMCRRFLADTEDFSEEKILAEGIKTRFSNEDFGTCLEQIVLFIQNKIRYNKS